MFPGRCGKTRGIIMDCPALFDTSVARLFSCLRHTSLGERAALVLFAVVCIQAVVQWPYVIVTRETTVNIWGGVLCCAAFLTAYWCAPGLRARLRSPATLVTLAAFVLLAASGFRSEDSLTASARGFVLWSSACGGYWCSRILLQGAERRWLFVWFCTVLLSVFLLMSIAGFFLCGSVHACFDEFRHPQVTMSFLLACAPLALLIRNRPPSRTYALLLLAVTCFVFFLSGLRTALIMPVVLGGVGLMLGRLRLRWFLLVALFFSLLLAAFLYLFPEKRLELTGEPLYYRMENYPFSWSITRRHPLLGIGLGVSREKYLDGYEIRYPYIDREDFAWTLRIIKVSENLVLTFMTGAGLPLTLLYLGAAGFLYVRLYKAARWRRPLEGLPPWAVFLPVTAGIGHFMLYDGLLQPQVCWFFHVLLALAVPVGNTTGKKE